MGHGECPTCGSVCQVRDRARIDVRTVDDCTYVLRLARHPWSRRRILHECVSGARGKGDEAGVPARPLTPRPTLHGAIASGRLTSVAEIGAALRAGTNCGSCIPELKAILNATRDAAVAPT